MGEGRPRVTGLTHEPFSFGADKIMAEVRTAGENCVEPLLLEPMLAADGRERNLGVTGG